MQPYLIYISTSCKPKSWELNYPYLLYGGYNADYASIMGMVDITSDVSYILGEPCCLG